MEENQTMEEEKETSRWITVLLIIGNIVIWGIILLFISIASVSAAPTTYPLDAWSVGHSGQDSGAIANNTSYSWAWPRSVYDTAYINIVFTARNGTTTAHARVETNFANFCLFSTYVFEGNTKTNITVTRQCSGTNNNNVDYYFQMVSHQGQNITLQLKPIPPLTLLSNMSITAKVSGSQDVELSNDLTNDTFINATNNQTTTIVNNITENVNELKEGFINALDENNKYCEDKTFDKENAKISETGKRLTDTGTLYNDNVWNVSDYYKINKNKTYTIRQINGDANLASFCLYDKEKVQISCEAYNGRRVINITPTQDVYIKFSIHLNTYNTTLTGNFCSTNTEATINAIDEFKEMFKVEPWDHITPDTMEFDDMEDAEDILHTHTDVDLNYVDVWIDTDTSSWVWNLLTRMLNTNRLIITFFISVLSIGIMKAILSR